MEGASGLLAGQLEVLAVNRMVPISEGMAPPGSPQGGWECPGLHSHGPVSGWRSRAVLLGTGLWPWPEHSTVWGTTLLGRYKHRLEHSQREATRVNNELETHDEWF